MIDLALQTALSAARAAGELQLEKFRGSFKVDKKGDIDLVTEIDLKCEELIRESILNAFPEHRVLGEEGGGSRSLEGPLWVVDPLDGTTNYAAGFPVFCVSIALLIDGVTQLGVVHAPYLRETYHAVRGQGAFLNGGTQLAIGSKTELVEATLATGFTYDVHETGRNLDHFANFIRRARCIRRAGSAALDLCWLAMGVWDGFWEMGLKPWDMAAGALMVEEAGGLLTDFSGGAFDLFGSEILGCNEALHSVMLEVLRQGR